VRDRWSGKRHSVDLQGADCARFAFAFARAGGTITIARMAPDLLRCGVRTHLMFALGLGCAKTRGSRISTEGFQPGGAVGVLSKINEFESYALEGARQPVGSSFGPLRNVFTQPRPAADIGQIEIPQRSSAVLSFLSEAREFIIILILVLLGRI
jgi:hypothetical protein